jgi:hypothetical protein
MFFRFADAPPQSPQSPQMTSSAPSSERGGLTFAGLAKTFLKIKRSDSAEAKHDSERQSPPALADPSSIPPAVQTAQALPTPLSSPQHSRTSSEGTGAASPTSPSSPLTFFASPMSFSPSSSPTSPRAPKQKRHHSESSSGQMPLSHPGLAEHACQRRESIERIDTFHCAGGVNVPVLLRNTRSELMELASILGANALIEEQYVSGPAHL